MNREQMRITELYDLTHTLAADYLSGFEYPWDALQGISDFIIALGNSWIRKNTKKETAMCGSIRPQRSLRPRF